MSGQNEVAGYLYQSRGFHTPLSLLQNTFPGISHVILALEKAFILLGSYSLRFRLGVSLAECPAEIYRYCPLMEEVLERFRLYKF